MKKTVLVTGGAGFIGSNFIYLLLDERPEWKVVCVDALTYAANIHTLNKAMENSNFIFYKEDIRNREGIFSIFEKEHPDIVVNFAAESHVDRSIENPGIFLETNILGTQVMMDACRKYGVERFHQVGTDEVYGDLPLDRPDLFFHEDTPIHTSSPYSTSKAAADLLTMAYHRTYGLPVTISRCSNNYGPYQFPEKLIPLMINNVSQNKKLPVYGEGLNVRDWLYVKDHCYGILAYMSANILSAMRTGATSGVGARHLAVKNPKTVAIIGPGTMGKYTLDAFISAQPSIDTIRIKGRSQKGINSFIEYCKENHPEIKKLIVCDDLPSVCEDADIIFYGTTNAAKFEDNPTVKKEWLKKGALVIAASALLVEPEFLSDNDIKLVSDNYAMYDGWGEGQPLPTQKNVSTLLGMGFYDAVTEGCITRESINEIGEILVGDKVGRESEDQIILYAVGGMPVEDVAWGYDVYQNALEKGIGTKLNVWETPVL